MKLEIARGLFLVAALGVASFAAASWYEPGTQVVSETDRGLDPLAPKAPTESTAKRPDEDLLLFIFGLSQGMQGSQ